MGVVLRANQIKVQGEILEKWDAGAKCVMPVMGTGTGKTALMAKTAAEKCKGRGIAQAHRSELVGQLSLAWAREGIEHDLTTSPAVRRQIIDNHLDKLGRSFYRPDADWSIESVDTAIKREPKRGINYVFQDEGHHCFTAGTLIDGRKIASLRVGDSVTAFDEITGALVQSHVTHVFKHMAPESMVRIRAAHHVLESTKCHPVWTKRGWVNAGDLTNDDYVYLHTLQDEIHPSEIQHAVPLANGGDSLLRKQPLRIRTQGGKSTTACNSAADQVQPVRCSMHCDRLDADEMAKNRDSLLLPRMCSGGKECEVFGNNECNKQSACICTHDSPQPNAQQRCSGKNEGVYCRESAKNQGWQRGTRNSCGNGTTTDAVTNGFCEPACGAHGCAVPQSLQDRLCAPHIQNCDRGGREIASNTCPQSCGFSQRQILKWARVASVEIYKSADSVGQHDGYVYNIEVANQHTYIANSIVVHNCLRANKWGRALEPYQDAKWLLPTATPGRADGMGLGAHADGHVNAMVLGPNLAEGMRDGFLVEYDILTPTAADLDLTGVAIGSNGELNQAETAKRVKQSSRIVGDAVDHYLKHASGRLCIVFAVDIEHAQTLLTAYLARGVPAELVTGKDLDTVRLGALKRFERRETLVLINVDLFGEGTDVPGVEVVQMCRPTASFSLFCQMIGRMLRLDIDPLLMRMWDSLPVHQRLQLIASSRKPKALLIDHVGNIYREFKICDIVYSGPPEGFTEWSLDRRGRKSNTGGAIPQRTCTECYQPYERFHNECPFCGACAPPPIERGGPEQVDGDLRFYDPEKLARIRAEVARIDGQFHAPGGLPPIAAAGAANQWHARQVAQSTLRDAIAMWAGKHAGAPDAVNYKRFYMTFGIDVPTAATLGATEADNLRQRIDTELLKI